MKKKYRDIIVDGVKYGWIVKGESLSIWLGKKMVYCENVNSKILPSMVADKIKELDIV